MQFTAWQGVAVADDYNRKPVVDLDGEPLFAELAILRLLQRAGFSGVWVDTYRGRILTELPGVEDAVVLPPERRALLSKIEAAHGRRGGCFDVYAWCGEEVLFVESKRRGKDHMTSNQGSWLLAALGVGINIESFAVVEWELAPSTLKPRGGERSVGESVRRGRYRHDAADPARLNKHGRPEPTRQPRFSNFLYCLVWADHDLLKVGLSSGQNTRDASAERSIGRFLRHQGVTAEPVVGWRAALPCIEGAAWGDCQRLEMVVATAIKRRLGASAAGAVGLEWLTREDLADVSWKEILTAATKEALVFSGVDCEVEWTTLSAPSSGDVDVAQSRLRGSSQRDAWRTMRNQRGYCAMKGCSVPLGGNATQATFRYCTEAHAALDENKRRGDARRG